MTLSGYCSVPVVGLQRALLAHPLVVMWFHWKEYLAYDLNCHHCETLVLK